MTRRLMKEFFWLLLSIAVALPVTGAWPASGADLDCLIEPYDVVDVSSPVDGVLESVEVERGDLVKEGQVIAKLESSVELAAVTLARARARAKAAVDAAETRLEFNKQRLTRGETLFEKDLIPLDELQQTQTEGRLAELSLLEAKEEKRLAQLDLRRAEAALARRTVHSPLTGVVVKRFLSAGEFTSGETARSEASIMRIAQLDPLRVEVFAPLSLLGQIAAGMEATVVPEALTETFHHVRVMVVDRVVDSASGTFGVRLQLPNPDYKIPAGLKCKIRFETGKSAPPLAESALERKSS